MKWSREWLMKPRRALTSASSVGVLVGLAWVLRRLKGSLFDSSRNFVKRSKNVLKLRECPPAKSFDEQSAAICEAHDRMSIQSTHVHTALQSV